MLNFELKTTEKFVLRDYQQEACDKAVDFLNDKLPHRPIIVAPTGSGKSLYIADITDRINVPTLVLQPSKELLEQNYGKYMTYGKYASIFSASMGEKEVGSAVTFGMIGSVINTAELFKHIEVVIIDECHLVPPDPNSQYMRLLTQELPHAKVLGLTATPIRMKTYLCPYRNINYSKLNVLFHERPRFFDSVLHITQISEMVDRGYYCPIKYRVERFDESLLEKNSTGADFTEQSMLKADEENQIEQRTLELVAEGLSKGRKNCLTFVRSVDQAERMADTHPDYAALSAKTKKKDRTEIVAGFKAGKIKAVFNVGVLTVGFDYPELDFVITARPTLSLALYMQMIGRGVRPAEGKDKLVYIDLCGNIDRFGRVETIKFEKIGRKYQITNNGKNLTDVEMGRDY